MGPPLSWGPVAGVVGAEGRWAPFLLGPCHCRLSPVLGVTGGAIHGTVVAVLFLHVLCRAPT